MWSVMWPEIVKGIIIAGAIGLGRIIYEWWHDNTKSDVTIQPYLKRDDHIAEKTFTNDTPGIVINVYENNGSNIAVLNVACIIQSSSKHPKLSTNFNRNKNDKKAEPQYETSAYLKAILSPVKVDFPLKKEEQDTIFNDMIFLAHVGNRIYWKKAGSDETKFNDINYLKESKPNCWKQIKNKLFGKKELWDILHKKDKEFKKEFSPIF